jgi:hypothetical protein
MDPYYLVYIPPTFNLMDLLDDCPNLLDIISHLTNLDASNLSAKNYLDFLKFDLTKERENIIEVFGLESMATEYIANQIAKADPAAKIILADGKRRTLKETIAKRGQPKAVFLTSVSTNFPSAAAAALVLNFAKIPVVFGGIHVSTAPDDLDHYLRKIAPHPKLISQVRGAGDSPTILKVVKDLKKATLKPEYLGFKTIEDQTWGNKRIDRMPLMKLRLSKKIPFVGEIISNHFRINTAAPYLGCPYACKFCSISSLPKKQRKLVARSAKDFVDELESWQKDGVNLNNRFFLFLTDNILLGGQRLEEILDEMIRRRLRINYLAQISMEIADNEKLLTKLRASGASMFFIGLESLNLKNLGFVGKRIVPDIRKSGLSVPDFYSQQIKKIQSFGISVIGSFIFGLPNDYFHSLKDHSAAEVAQFCRENRIGIQPSCLTDLPGSFNFKKSQKEGTYLYDKQGSAKYLPALCANDLAETNRIPPLSLKKSPLIVSFLAYFAACQVGSTQNGLRSGLFMASKAWQHPTENGRLLFRERVNDVLIGAISQLGAGLYKDFSNRLFYSRENYRGIVERLYDQEKSPEVKKIFKDFVQKYRHSS